MALEMYNKYNAVDYNRHLEEIASKIYRLILITIQECFTINKEQESTGMRLLEKWEEYKKLSKNDNEIRTMSEETELFKTKLKYLQSTIESFPTNKYVTNRTNENSEILKRIQTLYAHVEREGNLNAGGKFEWIDSTLVKCLQNGTWLLIDNVNLCNAAVLDRLNAVLEPGGSLIMGERGVDEHGELINIKPHPGFRLFLTMDPKNGEISRAMRNRGVEIYLLPPEEEIREDILTKDFQSILYNVGVKNSLVIEILTKIHLSIYNNIIGEKPSVTQLAHVGFLISQQIERGLNIYDSIESVISDVYLEGKTILNKDLIRISSDNQQTVSSTTFKDITLNTLQLQTNPLFAVIKQQTCVFTTQKFAEDDELIQYLLMIFVQKSDLSNLQLRQKYLELIFKNYLHKKLSNLDQYYRLITILYKNLKLLQCNHSEIINFPIDIRWMPESGLIFYLNLQQATYLSNLMSFFIYYQTKRNTLNIFNNTIQQRTSLTIFEFSQKFSTKERLIQNKIVKYIVNIKELFHNIIQKMFQDHCAEITDDNFVDLITAIEWYFRLLQISNLPIFLSNTKTKKLHYDNLNMLALYYRFFIKYLITKIIRVITTEIYDYTPFKDLIQIMKSIESCQQTSGSPIMPVCKRFTKYMSRTNISFKNEQQITNYKNFMAALRKADIPNQLHRAYTESDRIECHRQLLFLTDERTRDNIEKLSKYYCTIIIDAHTPPLYTDSLDFDTMEQVFNYFVKTNECIPYDTGNITKLQIIPIIQQLQQKLSLLTLVAFYDNIDTIRESINFQYVQQFIEFLEMIPNKYNSTSAHLYCLLKTFKHLLTLDDDTSTNMHQLVLPLQIVFYEFLDNLACRYPNNYIGNSDDAHPLETIDIHSPGFTYNVTNTLIDSSLNFGKIIKFSSLKNNQQTNENLELCLKLFQQNMCLLHSLKYDNVLNYANGIFHFFKIFLRTLTKSLNGENSEISEITSGIICGHIENCQIILNNKNPNDEDIVIKNICLFLNKSKQYLKEFWSNSDDLERKLDRIKIETQKYGFIDIDLEYFTNKLICTASSLSIGIGYSKAAICCQIPPIDPLISYEIRIKHSKEDQQNLHYLCAAHDCHVNVADDVTKFKHALYEKFKQKIVSLKTKTDQYDNVKIERPKEQKYDDLYHVITNFCNSQLHEVLTIAKDVHASIWALVECYEPKKFDRYNESLQASELWLLSVKRFLKQLSEYIFFPDIVYPIQVSIRELEQGVTVMNSLLRKLIIREQYHFEEFDLLNQLIDLIAFPTFHLKDYNYDTFLKIFSTVLGSHKQAEIQQEMLRMLLFSLQDNWNLLCCFQKLSNIQLWNKFYQLFNVLLTIWNQKEEEKQELKEAEESLYKTIERKNLTEDEQNDIDFKELFPSFYDKDFHDLTAPVTLEKIADKNKEQEQTLPKEITDKITYRHLLTDQQINFIHDIHTNICRTYTESEWLHQNKNLIMKPNFIKSLVQKYKTFCLIQNHVINGLHHHMDRNLLSSIMFLVNVVKSAESCENAEVFKSLYVTRMTHSSFDFYQDEYCGAVKDCMQLIGPLKEKIVEFLKSWPEHPILISIKIIVERIENFEITSPLSRFLTGFELLLGKCNEWQQFAPKSLSITDNIEMITRWIIDMRKFELQQWKNALDNVLARIQMKTKRFWFYIFNIIKQFTNETSSDTAIQIKDVIKTLKQFIEKSPIGEFQIRLELLKTFHCHCILDVKKMKHDKLRNILWNLYQFYNQFSAIVTNRIQTIRTPIEKEIKDFIKIIKWNDINYWSVKETVEKTHRKLHKFMRKFEESLNEPTNKNCLTLSQEDENHKVTNIFHTMEPCTFNPKDYVGESVKKLNQTLLQFTDSPPTSEINIMDHIQWSTDIISNFKQYYKHSRKMAKTIISSTKYVNLVEIFNDFCTNIIETASELRKLEVDTTLPTKSKQKSHAKSILQQKRKALADLFKNLKTIGLSYQSGLVEYQLNDVEHNYFLAKPIDINAALDNLQELSCDKYLKFQWDGCEKYYVRSISLYSQLLIAMGNPSPELDIQNLERIRGFSAHLLNSVQTQKNVIIENTRSLYYLRSHIIEMSNIFSNTYFDELKGTQNEINSFYNFFVYINCFMKQLKEFVHTCAQNTTNDATQLQIIKEMIDQTTNIRRAEQRNRMETDESNKSMSSKKSYYVILIENANYIEQISRQMIDYFHKFDYQSPHVEYTSTSCDFQQSLSEETLIEISCELDDITEFIKPIQNATLRDTSLNPLNNHINHLQREVQMKRETVDIFISKIQKFDDKHKKPTCSVNSDILPPQYVQHFSLDIEKYVHSLLLSIQKIFIKYENVAAQQNDATDVAEQSVGELPSDLLKIQLLQELTDDIQLFNISKLLTSLKNIISNYKFLLSDWQQCAKLFKKTLPLLNQLVILYQYFVTLQVSTYRTSCKLCYILLKIFCELSVKGFCTPEGLDADDDDGDGGEGDKSSTGGMGLSEGTGEKDVSDRIESEDQLEDAKREEDYEKQTSKEDDQKCPEEQGGIEMSEDFEGDLQDVDKDPDQESEPENNDEEENQMGETEQGAEQLDTRLWGDKDDESEDDDDNEAEGEQGDGEEADNPDAEGKDSKGKSAGEKKLGANTEEQDEEDGTQEPDTDKTQEKEINELNEPDYDDDQVNPYHGKHDPLPEPEDFDLPEDMQLDDGEPKQDNEDESAEDNPFDIDNMKEKMPEINEPKDDETQNAEEENNKSSDKDDADADEDDEQIKLELETDNLDEEPKEEPKTETSGENQEESEDKTKPLEEDKSNPSKDKPSNEENVQSADRQDVQSTQDNVQANSDKDDAQTRNPDDEINTNENLNEKQGIGQAQREDINQGHTGNVQKADNMSSVDENEKKLEKRQRPGNTDSDRSLGNISEPIKKRFKAMDLEKNITVEDEDKPEDDKLTEQKDSEHYQHIKESKRHDTQIFDAATDEQADKQQVPNENGDDNAKEAEDSDVEISEEVPEVLDETNETEKLETEKLEGEKKKSTKKSNEGDQLNDDMEMRMDVEGEIVETQNMPRGNETTFHTNFENIIEPYTTQKMIHKDLEMRQELERKLSDWTETPTDAEAHSTWLTYTSLTSSLAHDLCEQLRLILEPTQISRLKGDYRSGRRINMRKIIPYIASQFRKDKIWLRRTRPAKREYQIVIAIDDSQSMADNHSKELAFESLSLLSSALTLLESGQLSVLSFGEKTDLLHRLGEQFTEQSGATILQKFKFEQKKTNVAHLVQFTCDMFKQCDLNQKATIAKLLIIVSDGRGVYSQGEEMVINAVRRAKHENIFMIFVIVDNPQNKNSILDIQMPMFQDKKLVGMKSYLENFPFSFYIILRDINQLPSVLSDALRQWFELVTSSTV